MLDTHAIARQLTAAGVEPPHADAITDAVRLAAEYNDADLVTKTDLDSRDFVTKDYLDSRDFVTKAYLDSRDFVTKDYLDSCGFVTKDYLDSCGFVTKADLDARDYVTKADLAALEARLYKFLLVQGLTIIGLTVGITRLL